MSDAKRTEGNVGGANDHLANERTFLSWVRTSITVVGLGFVVARFGVIMKSGGPAGGGGGGDGAVAGVATGREAGEYGVWLGVAMVVLGVALTVLGAWRHGKVKRALEEGRPVAAGESVWLITGLVVLLGAAILGVVVAGLTCGKEESETAGVSLSGKVMRKSTS